MAGLIEVQRPPATPKANPAQPRPNPTWLTKPCHMPGLRAVPDCAVPHCAGLGLAMADVTFYLPRQCTCNWLRRRSLTSGVVVVVVAALTHFLATHLTQLRALFPCSSLSLSLSLPPLWVQRGFDFYHWFWRIWRPAFHRRTATQIAVAPLLKQLPPSALLYAAA